MSSPDPAPEQLTACPHQSLEVTAWYHWADLLVRCPQCGAQLTIPMTIAASLQRQACAAQLGRLFGPAWQQAVEGLGRDQVWGTIAPLMRGADRSGVRRVRRAEVAL